MSQDNLSRSSMTKNGLLALAVAASLAACGTTVPGARSSGSLDGLGSAGQGPTAPNPGSGSAEGALPARGGSSAAPLAGPGAGSLGGPAAPGATGSDAAPAARPGVKAATLAPVEIGFLVSKNADALFKAYGYGNLAPGDQETQVKVVVAYVNAHGGLAGHRITPVFGVWDAAGGDTVTQREAACSNWLQDHHVQAIVAESFDSFTGCATKAHVPLIVGNLYPVTGPQYARATTMLSTMVPTDDRLLPAWVDRLAEGGYFTPAPVRIGVVYVDTPDQHYSLDHVLKPALARRGQSVADSFALPLDVAQAVAQESNAVLQFKAHGVDHVMFLDTGGMALTFLPQAESQGYRPRYAMHSYSSPALVQSAVPQAQLVGAMAAGWLPSVDVAAAQRPRPTAAATLCVSLMQKAGQDMSSDSARSSALNYCDRTFLLQAASNAAPSFTPAGIMAGLTRLGSSYESAVGFGQDFRTRRDGPAVMRLSAFSKDCSCFKYVSGPVSF
jgi:ABC-type branched-subunit amino acid transport system substrate-binding protein